jgi:hypothetical protein
MSDISKKECENLIAIESAPNLVIHAPNGTVNMNGSGQIYRPILYFPVFDQKISEFPLVKERLLKKDSEIQFFPSSFYRKLKEAVSENGDGAIFIVGKPNLGKTRTSLEVIQELY